MDFSDQELDRRMEQAIQSNTPFDALYEIARELVDAGMPKDDLTRLFMRHFEMYGDDEDGTIYDAIADVLDYITGWCSAPQRLYPDES